MNGLNAGFILPPFLVLNLTMQTRLAPKSLKLLLVCYLPSDLSKSVSFLMQWYFTDDVLSESFRVIHRKLPHYWIQFFCLFFFFFTFQRLRINRQATLEKFHQHVQRFSNVPIQNFMNRACSYDALRMHWRDRLLTASQAHLSNESLSSIRYIHLYLCNILHMVLKNAYIKYAPVTIEYCIPPYTIIALLSNKTICLPSI